MPIAVSVIKHQAPNGALRPRPFVGGEGQLHGVPKHRAPKGALRPVELLLLVDCGRVRKHRAPQGALRRLHQVLILVKVEMSDNIEYHQISHAIL